ncbi:MAG: hypothetical protein M1587_02820, partial [Thaumarchaeota archaeon]|nr:hypothetical protein [Nitrososphaerota archaeon]
MLQKYSLTDRSKEALMASAGSYAVSIINSFGLEQNKKRASSFAFSSKMPPPSAKAFTFDAPYAMYYVQCDQLRAGEARSLAGGIALENFVLLIELANGSCFFVIRRAKKLNDPNGNPPVLILPVRSVDDVDRIIVSARKFRFLSDELTAHASVSSLYDQLKSGAERYFTNRGLFSAYYLRERLFRTIQEHGRNVSKEAEALFSQLGSADPSEIEPDKVLTALGFDVTESRSNRPNTASTTTYDLSYRGTSLGATAILVISSTSSSVDSLDIRSNSDVAPSYLAVSALRKTPWVILTNGRIWRLYSDKVSSISTDYFEIDLEGVALESDPRLLYFVSLFSAQSFVPLKTGISELDSTFEGSQQYAEEIKNDMRTKVFDKQLFLNLVRGVLDHDKRKRYSKEELENGKSIALKLLYRLLFILYAESRGLLPTDNSDYFEISFENLRQRLQAMERDPDATNIWKSLRFLFMAINKGSHDHNIPEYDGALFEEDKDLDGLQIKNKYIAPALHDLAEKESKGIDYQNLGVRHLGSLYEGLLEYSVEQATKELVICRDEILDAKYAEDLKGKPQGYIAKGELYLSIGGLARKGTGSYYTADEIVSFLVGRGLELHFYKRKQRFIEHLNALKHSEGLDEEGRKRLEDLCDDDLLGIRVVDPAMGSGHFIVSAVDEITNWVIR